MLRAVLAATLGGALRLFFRRIEVVGRDRVPTTGPTLFAINHPNALVDPILLLCYAPRPVSFLGKAPLFRIPVIGWLARALETIPVHRRQDGTTDPRQNRETFARARSLLENGGTIAIAPEGASHSDPKHRPIKTGAARIALGAGTSDPVAIVPVGLFYTEKAVFRSSALVLFGEPLRVVSTAVDADGEPPAQRVTEVTSQLEAALAGLVPQADDHEAHRLAARAERLVTAALTDPKPRALDDVRVVRQRLLDGYRHLRDREPILLGRLTRRVDRLDRAFRRAGLSPADIGSRPPALASVPRAIWWLLVRVVVFLPLALPGAVIHYPAYRLIGMLARRVAKTHDDVLATAKIIGAFVFYPVTWLLVGWSVGSAFGWPVGLAAGIFAPVTGYAAVKLVERFDRFVSATKAFGFYLAEPEHYERLATECDALRRDLLEIAGRLDASGQAAPTR